jgi:hypothetical protein
MLRTVERNQNIFDHGPLLVFRVVEALSGHLKFPTIIRNS